MFITNLINKITDFRVKIGDKLNTLKSQIGQLNLLTTNDKTSLVGAINEVNNIQIGGRNLLLQTTTSEINLVGGVDIYAEKAYKISNLEKNTEYIFSVIAKGDEMTLISFIPNIIVDYKSLTTEFKLYTWKFSTSNEPAILDFLIRAQVGKNITITKAKLEKGNKSTDWTPAPEDQVSNWAETDSNSLSFIKGKEIVNNEFNNVYDQISSRANNRLSNLVFDLTQREKGTIRDKIGVVLPTVNDGKLTLTTGTGLNGSTNFTANQSSNSIFDVSVASTHKLPSTAEWDDTLKKNESNTVTDDFSMQQENGAYVSIASNGLKVGFGGITATYGTLSISVDNLVPDAASKFQEILFPIRAVKNVEEKVYPVTYVQGVKADETGRVDISGVAMNWSNRHIFSKPIEATSFYESSLKKYKKNIKPYNSNALEVINSLNIVTYDRTDTNILNKIGIIADDSHKDMLNEGCTAVDLYKTVFVLVKSVQELSAKIKELEKQK